MAGIWILRLRCWLFRLGLGDVLFLVPFISGVPTPFAATFSREDFEKIRVGVVPEIMEDKWFVYFEEPHLFMHRSWTGLPVYRLTLAVHGDGASVVEALCVAEALEEYDSEYHANLLDFLISSLLLGKAKPFPVPAGTRKSKTGIASTCNRRHRFRSNPSKRTTTHGASVVGVVALGPLRVMKRHAGCRAGTYK